MSATLRLPTLFAAHGGGPMPLLGDPNHAGLTRWFKAWPKSLPPNSLKAIAVVSAHWEEPVATVTSHPKPSLIYDYYGFPKESYSIKYDAPGAPELAARIASLLTAAGIPARSDPSRGLDHGVFVPLKAMFPEALLPVVELSLVAGLDPKLHIDIGRALAPLRDEGVLLVGSGFSFHNMPAFFAGPVGAKEVAERSGRFDSWLGDVLAGEGKTWEERRQALEGWAEAPDARYCHPREEHLLPLMVAFGAGAGDPGKVVWNEVLMNAVSSSVQFG